MKTILPSKTFWRRALLTILGLAILAGIIEIAIHHYDPTRVVYRRLKAPDLYLYEKIDPELHKTNVASLIRPDVIGNPEATRSKLIDAIWGPDGYPGSIAPTKIETGIRDMFLGDLPDGTQLTKLYFEPGLGLSSWPYLARSPNARNRLVIYHHGFGDPIDRMSGFLSALLADGYDVLAINALGHGGTLAFVDSNQDGILPAARQSRKSNIFHQMSHFERPLKYHLDPIVGALYAARQIHDYETVDMVGFSMGGFLTMLSAAVIPDIERIFSLTPFTRQTQLPHCRGLSELHAAGAGNPARQPAFLSAPDGGRESSRNVRIGCGRRRSRSGSGVQPLRPVLLQRYPQRSLQDRSPECGTSKRLWRAVRCPDRRKPCRSPDFGFHHPGHPAGSPSRPLRGPRRPRDA